MNVAIIGTGYVGLVSGTCFAEVGHDVVCMDRDAEKIAGLKRGEIPIFEAGLESLVARNVAGGRLRFTTSLQEALDGAQIVFLAIGTPQGEDGSADLSMVLDAADQIGSIMTAPLILVQKSTCPVGTALEMERRVRAKTQARRISTHCAVVCNPEFLREGNAVKDFMQPDRVVIGADDEEAGHLVASLYQNIVSSERILIMDRASAELTKYAANAFLATKISFINDIANLCELVGADVENVRRGIGSDGRIGAAFLAAGLGYGGSCFPKDVQALVKTSRNHGYPLRILEAVETVNRDQAHRQIDKVIQYFKGDLVDKHIAVWGVAFKPGTDDMREAPSIFVTRRLTELGAHVVAYDPVAMDQASRVFDRRVRFAIDAIGCVEGAHALIVLTEWPEFQTMDLNDVARAMSDAVLFDGRNSFHPDEAARAGFKYVGVGRPARDARHPATTP